MTAILQGRVPTGHQEGKGKTLDSPDSNSRTHAVLVVASTRIQSAPTTAKVEDGEVVSAVETADAVSKFNSLIDSIGGKINAHTVLRRQMPDARFWLAAILHLVWRKQAKNSLAPGIWRLALARHPHYSHFLTCIQPHAHSDLQNTDEKPNMVPLLVMTHWDTVAEDARNATIQYMTTKLSLGANFPFSGYPHYTRTYIPGFAFICVSL